MIVAITRQNTQKQLIFLGDSQTAYFLLHYCQLESHFILWGEKDA